MPSHREGRRDHRHDAARAGRRDRLRAGRRRRARVRWRTWRSSSVTPTSPRTAGTPTGAAAAVGTPAIAQAAARVREKAHKIAAHELEVPGTSSVVGRRVPSAGHPTSPRRSPRSRSPRARAQPPARRRARAGRVGVLRPGEPRVPVRCAHLRGRGGHRDGRRDGSRSTGRRHRNRPGTRCSPRAAIGAIQGIAEALYEEAAYDEDGNPDSSNMANYADPRGPRRPVDRGGMPTVTPSTTNELGIKGVGETGTIASPPAVLNAVVDALTRWASPRSIDRRAPRPSGGRSAARRPRERKPGQERTRRCA